MKSNFIEEVSKNVTFVLEFLGIILALFVVAFVMEKLAKKRTGDTERILSTRKMAMIGMFSAIAYYGFCITLYCTALLQVGLFRAAGTYRSICLRTVCRCYD